MQADAVLRSFFLHCAEADKVRVSVLYTCSNEQHARQYSQLEREWGRRQSVAFVKQRRFRQDTLNIATAHETPKTTHWLVKILGELDHHIARLILSLVRFPSDAGFILFLVDDAIFTRDFRMREVVESMLASPDALGFSLRLGENTTYCYMAGQNQRLPEFHPVDADVVRFNWTIAELDFGYPLEVSSSVYRRQDVLPLLLRAKFSNPTSLEGSLHAQRLLFVAHRSSLLCFKRSAAFCDPINMVQTTSLGNRSGMEDSYSSRNLAELFDQGKRVRVESFSHFVATSCHQVVPLKLCSPGAEEG